MTDLSEASGTPNTVRRAHGFPELYKDQENRAQALHLACLTVQTNQASDAVTSQIIKRANVFLRYIKEGTAQ